MILFQGHYICKHEFTQKQGIKYFELWALIFISFIPFKWKYNKAETNYFSFDAPKTSINLAITASPSPKSIGGATGTAIASLLVDSSEP